MKQNKQKRNENTRQKNKQTQENVKYKEKKQIASKHEIREKTQKFFFHQQTLPFKQNMIQLQDNQISSSKRTGSRMASQMTEQ